MKKVRNYVLSLLAIAATLMSAGCVRAYDVPEIVTIEASQTAFLIPLDGDTSSQNVFASEALLAQSEVATKQIQIPHRFVQTGRQSNQGKYIPTMKLIVVERKPETREWTNLPGSGTGDGKNEGIGAESKDQIGFTAFMNCAAQIDSQNAAKFLYRYNNKPLAQIMDTEIRARIETVFVEECAKYPMTELAVKKAEIMDAVRSDVIPYFAERGITITMVGLKDGLYFDSRDIQASIDEKIASENKLIIQQNNNAVKIAAAEADAQAKKIAADAEAAANKAIAESLTPELVEFLQWTKVWDGKLPYYVGGNGELVQIPAPTK